MFYGGHFDIDSKLLEIKKLEEETNDFKFWDDNDRAQRVIAKLNNLNSTTDNIVSLRSDVSDALDLISLLEEEYDEDIYSYVLGVHKDLFERMNSLELELLLSECNATK